MTAEERRWKWVKKESLPDDFAELIEKLSKKKEKKKKDKDIPKAADAAKEDDEELSPEYITTVKTRNDLTIDYTLVQNVKERLEILKQERIKGKFDMGFHVQVLTRIADQMVENVNDLFEIKLKVNVLILLAATFIQTAKTIGVLSRDDWLQTHKRVNQLLTLI